MGLYSTVRCLFAESDCRAKLCMGSHQPASQPAVFSMNATTNSLQSSIDVDPIYHSRFGMILNIFTYNIQQ